MHSTCAAFHENKLGTDDEVKHFPFDEDYAHFELLLQEMEQKCRQRGLLGLLQEIAQKAQKEHLTPSLGLMRCFCPLRVVRKYQILDEHKVVNKETPRKRINSYLLHCFLCFPIGQEMLLVEC